MGKNNDIKFFELLEIGKQKEREAYELLFKLFELYVIETRNDDKFDFRTNDNITYEVKFDRLTLKTGNFFIEYQTVKEYIIKNEFGQVEGIDEIKRSGISTTQADKYILVNAPNNSTTLFYIVDVGDLKELIKANNYNKRYCENTKTNILSWGYLIPSADIVRISKLFIKSNDIYTEIKQEK